MKYFYMFIVLSTITVVYSSNLYSSNNLVSLRVNEVKPTILSTKFFSLRNYTDIKIDISIQSNEKEKSELTIPENSGVLINCLNNYSYEISLNGIIDYFTCGKAYIITENLMYEYEI